jgi:hypothetical protein
MSPSHSYALEAGSAKALTSTNWLRAEEKMSSMLTGNYPQTDWKE